MLSALIRSGPGIWFLELEIYMVLVNQAIYVNSVNYLFA